MNSLIRVKWNRLKSNLTLGDIASYVKSNKYSEELGYGYSDIEISDDFFSATYTETKINTQTSIDPLGNENEQEFISYESIDFSISKLTGRLYLLSIYNPPKSIKSLTGRLSTDSGYRIGFSVVDIKLSEYFKELSEKHDFNIVKIKRIKISSLIVNENSKASIDITSKNNALEDIKEIINDKNYSLDKVKASGFIFGGIHEFEISKSGALCTSNSLVEYFTSTISNYILEREI